MFARTVFLAWLVARPGRKRSFRQGRLRAIVETQTRFSHLWQKREAFRHLLFAERLRRSAWQVARPGRKRSFRHLLFVERLRRSTRQVARHCGNANAFLALVPESEAFDKES